MHLIQPHTLSPKFEPIQVSESERKARGQEVAVSVKRSRVSMKNSKNS